MDNKNLIMFQTISQMQSRILQLNISLKNKELEPQQVISYVKSTLKLAKEVTKSCFRDDLYLDLETLAKSVIEQAQKAGYISYSELVPRK